MKIFKDKTYGNHKFHSIADQLKAEKKAFAKAKKKRKKK